MTTETKHYATTNKATGWTGCASVDNGELVRIYEGNPDGSDDKVVTLAEFEAGWDYKEEDE